MLFRKGSLKLMYVKFLTYVVAAKFIFLYLRNKLMDDRFGYQ
jgi:hypothetical protein